MFLLVLTLFNQYYPRDWHPKNYLSCVEWDVNFINQWMQTVTPTRFDLDIWHAGCSLPCLGRVWRSKWYVIDEGHGRKNVVVVVAWVISVTISVMLPRHAAELLVWTVLQVAAGDGQPPSRQMVTGEIPAYVDCQTNIMRLTKQVAQTVQEMVSLCTLTAKALLHYHSICLIYTCHLMCRCVLFSITFSPQK